MKRNYRAAAILLSTAVLVGGLFPAWGALGTLGGISVHAEASTGAINRLNEILAKLTSAELADVAAARSKLSVVTNVYLTDPIWTPISVKIGGSTQFTHVTQANILQLLKDTGFPFETTDFETARQTHRNLLFELKKLSGVTTSASGITLEDMNAFVNGVESKTKLRLQAMSNSDLLALVAGGETQLVNNVLGVVENGLADTLSDNSLVLANVLKGLGITAPNLMDLRANFAGVIDSNHAAEIALVAGYIRTQSELVRQNVSSDGRTFEPILKVWGHSVPDALVSWEVVPNTVITYTSANNKVSLSGSVTTGSATLIAKDKVKQKELYRGTIPMTYIPPTPSDPSPTPSSTPTQEYPVDSQNAQKQLDQLDDSLKKLLTVANGDQGLHDAMQHIEDAVRELTTINASKAVKVENGVASVNLDANLMDAAFAKAEKIFSDANTKLKQLAGASASKIKSIATIDLGKVAADSTNIPISADIIAKAKAHGIDALSLKVNGVSLTVDVDQFNGATQLNITKKPATSAPAGLSAASDIYNFEFASGTQILDSFTKPVVVRIPITNLGSKDADLLVFAKLNDNGELTYKGGEYDAETHDFVVSNYRFSTYAIVEHKVKFNDTATVKDWAGRQIDVVAAKGILEGRETGKFEPNVTITRAEFLKMIVKAYGLDDPNAKAGFSDVKVSDWFAPYVAVAAKAKLIEGRKDGIFAPNEPITRAEMAVIAARAMTSFSGYKPVPAEEALKNFSDAAQVHPWLTPGVAFAAKYGLIVGDEKGLFHPNDSTTRAHAAVVIYRLLNK